MGQLWDRAFGLTLPTEEVQYLEQYLAAYITGDDGENGEPARCTCAI